MANIMKVHSCCLDQPVQIYKIKMSTVLEGNSEANFVFATMIEFCHLWKSRKEASFSIDCKEGNASLNFKCSLGHPDEKHINPHHLGHPDQEHRNMQ